MTSNDLDYFRLCATCSLPQSPFLEVGSAKVETLINLCDVAQELGVTSTLGVDLVQAEGVDHTFDFSIPREDFNRKWPHLAYGTVALFNTLEHTFDPLLVLQNALSCVRPGGTLIVVVPSLWPIHKYPKDYCRLLPDWYCEFATRFDLELMAESFCWISAFGLFPIHSKNEFPNFQNSAKAIYPFRYWRSRLVHKVLNTYGRSHWGTHVSIGAAFRTRPAS